MKKNKLFLALFILFFVQMIILQNGFSQTKLGENTKNDAKNHVHEKSKKIFDNALLWEISGKNQKNTMYIMGTHHLFDKSFLDTEPTIQRLLPKIDAFVGELHEDSLESVAKGATMMKYMLLENTTLKELLSEKEYKKVDKALKTEAGIALSILNNMKPALIAQYIQLAKYMKLQGKEKINLFEQEDEMDNSIDMYFQKFGKENKKKIMGLETVEFQMQIMYEGIDLKKQVKNLMDIVENKNGGSDTEMQKMDEYYINQNINALYDFIAKYSSEEEMEILLYKRNKAWIPLLTKMLQSSEKHFVAVGAGHLVGKFGVLTMLEEAGYTLNPIKLDMKKP